MIINKEEQTEVLSNFDTDSIDMTIDDTDKEVLMHILSTGLYQDPIGSLIRENVSNNLDATVEAGSTEPVIVGIKQDENYKWYFYSQDFGTGISPERMEKIVSKYAASTKRGDGKQKGYFGLGLKSGLAYTDSFWIITNFGGTKYSYLMYKGEEGGKIELMDSQLTEEKNGTTFKVYLKDSYNDKLTFKEKMVEQLSYIDNLYFDVQGFDNKYPIYKSEHWWYTPKQPDSNLHIVLDGIYYPIDFNKLGIKRIETPIALKFDLSDGLVPVPSRESIIMSPATKQKIIDKIKLVARYFVDKYNETVTNVDCWFQYERLCKVSKFEVNISDSSSLNFTHLIQHSKEKKIQNPNFTGFEFKLIRKADLIDNIPQLLYPYSMVAKIKGGTYTTKSLYGNLTDNIRYNRNTSIDMIIVGSIDRWKIDYIKDTYNKEVCIYRRDRPMKLGYRKYNNNSYSHLLKLGSYPKDTWRERIKEIQEFEKWLSKKYTVSFDNIEIPQEWMDKTKEERKKNRKVTSRKEVGSFLIRRVSYSDRADWKGTFDNFDVDSDSVKSLKGLWIYTTEENKNKLGELSAIAYNRSRIKLAVIAKLNLKRVKDLRNFITYEEFMKGETKPFKVYATALLIAKEFANTRGRDYSFREKIRLIDPEFLKLIEKITEYSSLVNIYRSDENLCSSIVKHAQENNLFDLSMMSEYQQFLSKMNEYSFIDLLDFGLTINKKGRDKDKAVSLAREILKYRKLNKKKKEYEKDNYLETEVSLPARITIEQETKEINILKNII